MVPSSTRLNSVSSRSYEHSQHGAVKGRDRQKPTLMATRSFAGMPKTISPTSLKPWNHA